jgi:hypothetical protein
VREEEEVEEVEEAGDVSTLVLSRMDFGEEEEEEVVEGAVFLGEEEEEPGRAVESDLFSSRGGLETTLIGREKMGSGRGREEEPPRLKEEEAEEVAVGNIFKINNESSC